MKQRWLKLGIDEEDAEDKVLHTAHTIVEGNVNQYDGDACLVVRELLLQLFRKILEQKSLSLLTVKSKLICIILGSQGPCPVWGVTGR